MQRLFIVPFFALSFLFGAQQARAFSLLGPLAPWQTERLGYELNMPLFGGPVSIGEEYRWNVPVVYYAFTPEFLSYFGQTGVTEIEKAIRFLNNLPRAEQMNIDDFPLSSQRLNHRAQALGLLDLKSYALSVMMNEIGLCDPTRFVYTLRSRWIGPGPAPTNYYVIKRNFDPVTWQHSSYINGQLWTYSLVTDVTDTESFVFTEPVDPLALLGLINAPVTSGVGNDLLVFGGFWTGFTRDDVGGIKYVYRRSNFNVENAPPIATGTFGGGPWGVPPPATTNVVTNLFVDLALRPGIDKITFVRAKYDSEAGIFVPFTNAFTDTIITNGRAIQQNLQRPVPIADLLFDSSDLQDGDAFPVFVTVAGGFQPWDNNDPENGLIGDLGPGVIQPALGIPPQGSAFTITFNSVGPTFWNIWPNFLSEASAVRFFLWGSFDGSTNEPVVYPINTSIQDLERQVLGGGGPGNPFGVP
jgi:hypothetical protein